MWATHFLISRVHTYIKREGERENASERASEREREREQERVKSEIDKERAHQSPPYRKKESISP